MFGSLLRRPVRPVPPPPPVHPEDEAWARRWHLGCTCGKADAEADARAQRRARVEGAIVEAIELARDAAIDSAGTDDEVRYDAVERALIGVKGILR